MLTVSTKDLMAAAPGPRGPGRPAAGWWTTGTVLPVAAVQAEWRCLNWVCRDDLFPRGRLPPRL